MEAVNYNTLEPYIKKSFNRGVKLPEKSMILMEQFCSEIQSGKLKMEAIKCLCGADNYILIANEDRYGIPINTVLCKECGLVYSTPYYTKETLEYFYKNYYRSIYTDNAECTESFFVEQIDCGYIIQHRLKKFLNNGHKKVFEIGCGGGGILKSFQNNGFEVYGCDYGEQYLKYGREKGLTLEAGDYQTLKRYGKADVLILNHILEHIVSPIEFLVAIRDLLSKNGILYIELPTIETIKLWYGSDIYRYLQNAHIYYFSNKYLENLCRVAGYELLIQVKEGVCIAKKTDNFSDLSKDANEYKRILQLLQTYELSYLTNELSNILNYPRICKDFSLTIIAYTRYIFKDYSIRELNLFGIKIKWKKYKK